MKKKLGLMVIILLIVTIIVAIVFITNNKENIANQNSKNHNLSKLKNALNAAILECQMQYSNAYMEDETTNAKEYFTPHNVAIAIEKQGYYLYLSPESSGRIDTSQENILEKFSDNHFYYVGTGDSEIGEYIEFKITITDDGANISFP